MDCRNLSASLLSTFKECQLKYYAYYVLRLKDETKHPAARVGSAVHKILEHIMKTKAVPDVTAICKEFLVPGNEEEIRKIIKSTLKNGYLNDISFNHGVEVPFKEKIEGIDVPIVGYIDRLDIKKSTAVVYDIKSGKMPYNQFELKDNFQAQLYDIAVKQLFPEVTNTDIIFWFVRMQSRPLVSFTREQTMENIEKIKTLYKKIVDTAKPKPTKTKWCTSCVYYSQCPLFRKLTLNPSL